MVGIVVVSHSHKLAEGVAELAIQMTQGKVNLATAAGVDDPENPIGTDAIAVMSAIEEVCDDSGVVVFMDLGSALLSTEMALDLLDEEVRDKVVLISAPIVEGTMAASVAAAAGLPIDTVIAEATSALDVKKEHLGESISVNCSQEKCSDKLDPQALTMTWSVKNPHGIHARPAAAIVGCLAPLSSEVHLEKGQHRVNAKSLNSIAKLNIRCDDDITLYASGLDAQQAIDTFSQLAHNHFGEAEIISQGINVEPHINDVVNETKIEGALAGISINSGIVSAPAFVFAQEMPKIPDRDFVGIDLELAKLQQAVSTVKQKLESQSAQPHGDIFAAHAMMLTDPEIISQVEIKIAEKMIAEQAWFDVMATLAEQYQCSDSQYMRERESDVYDICRQVMFALTNAKPKGMVITQPSILLARDLMPSDVAGLDKEKVVAICLSEGGKTSHSAILARAMGIPAIVKVKGCLEQVRTGDNITIDGFNGLLWFAPSQVMQEQLNAQRKKWLSEQELALKCAQTQAITLDGTEINVMANIGGPADIALALDNGAEGVGLFRTEFLFQDNDKLPTEQQQYDVYVKIAEAFGDKPITIRSLDVGGDKPLSTYPMPEEDNPFLGQRGVRLCLKHQSLFATQLRAVIKAHSQQPNIKLMIPMIATVAEVKAVKALIAEQYKQLGLTDMGLSIGIMIEVPAAVFNADALAAEVDFFSIGTNDLTQYVMAADRGNSNVSELVNYFEPAVLKAIKLTIDAAYQAGIDVSMCGEMAGDSEATQQLVELGLRKFSASSSLLPALKQHIRELDLTII